MPVMWLQGCHAYVFIIKGKWNMVTIRIDLSSCLFIYAPFNASENFNLIMERWPQYRAHTEFVYEIHLPYERRAHMEPAELYYFIAHFIVHVRIHMHKIQLQRFAIGNAFNTFDWLYPKHMMRRNSNLIWI